MKNFACLLFALLLLWASPACAEPDARQLPETRGHALLSFAPVVKKVSPAVVNIYTRKIVKQKLMSPFFDDPLFQQFFGEGFADGGVRQRMEKALGSGVIVRADGLIVTNNHVISGADEITVVLSDRREFDAKLLMADERTDLAVLRIDARELPFLELADSDAAEVGDLVLAIGNPFGVGQTVTNGIVSALARTAVDINDYNYFIQTDAPINPGNSGGALVGMDGKLLGINSAIFTRSGGTMGIGFAIPSNMVRSIIQAASEGKKKVVHPWTGIGGQEVTAELAGSLNLPRPAGMIVNALAAQSPAKKAGLAVGDVIVALNGKPVEDPSAFRFRIAMLSVGGTASIEAIRQGRKIGPLSLELVAPPENPPRDKTIVKGTNPLMGATLMNLSPAVAEELGMRDADTGVVVGEVGSSSVARRVGIRPGDVVVAINGQETPTVRSVLSALNAKPLRWQLSLKRGDQVLNLILGG